MEAAPDWEEARSLDGRKALTRALGVEQVRAWHQPSPWLDALTIVGGLGQMAVAVAGTALLPFGPLWLLCALIQPVLLYQWTMISHDLFAHRQVGGSFWAWVGSMVFTIPRLTLPSRYLHSHRLHHRYIGTERDGELYKQALDTPARRWWFLTIDGAFRAPGLARELGPPMPAPEGTLARRIAIEKGVRWLYLALLLAGCVGWPKVFLFGHLLPYLVLGPIVNVLRILVEHPEADDANPLFLGVNYKSGWLLRWASCCNGGDCHIIHHLYPNMPWYRVPAAVAAAAPLLRDSGVTERSSFWWVVHGWFIEGKAHRTVW